MAVTVTKIDVWSGMLDDQPGGLARILEQLSGAKANLEMVVARRQPDRPGSGIVFLAPVKGKKVSEVATGTCLRPAEGLAALRIQGDDRPGLGHRLTQTIADAGISLRGLSAAVIGRKFVAYLAFDSAADADQAARALRGLNKAPARRGASRAGKSRR